MNFIPLFLLCRSLIDPVLAFIKAYRLRGDSAGLKQSVCSSSAHRRLWDYCSKELEQLGLPYHARCGSDRLGRKPDSPNAAADPSTRPRPFLIKCASAWDRRLLLAFRRKLKDSTKYKPFLHEDLPPNKRHSKRSSGHVGTVNNTHPLTLTSQDPSSDTTHTSAIPHS